MIGMHYKAWPFDNSQRRVMMDESRLVTIRGGAGSGRTHVLLARCFKLLRFDGVPAEEMQVLVSTPEAAEGARQVLAEAGGCQVDTAVQFSASLVRQAQGTDFTLLSDRDAAGLLSTYLAGNWEVMDESRGSRWAHPRERAARMLASGNGNDDRLEEYLRECGRRKLYDRWRIVERAAECLEENPQLAAELRGGPSRWLLADDVHRWGRAERRLLDALIDDDVRVTLAGDPAQRVDGGRDVLNWLEWVWKDEVSPHQLELCHRSSGSICDLANWLSRWKSDGYLPWGEDPVWTTGATPVESEAMAAETIAEWMATGLRAEDIAVIDLVDGRGVQDIGVHLARVGARMDRGPLVDGEAGDGMDAAAMLRLALNSRDVVALARSWRRADGGPRQAGARLVNPVILWSAAWDRNLLAAAAAMVESNQWAASMSSWLTDVAECQRALDGALARGRGIADVLNRRRDRIFDPRGPGSVAFQDLAAAVSEATSRGQSRARLAEALDRRALVEREKAGPGTVEVLGVSEAGGREWRGVCVINAVRPADDAAASRRMAQLYVACSRAKDRLAVCDYRVDHAWRPVVPLLRERPPWNQDGI